MSGTRVTISTDTPEPKLGFVEEREYNSAEDDASHANGATSRSTSGHRSHHSSSGRKKHKLKTVSEAAKKDETIAKLTKDLSSTQEVLMETQEEVAEKARLLKREESERKRLTAQALGELVVTKGSLKKVSSALAETQEQIDAKEKKLKKEQEKSALLHKADARQQKKQSFVIDDLQDQVEEERSEKSERARLYAKHNTQMTEEINQYATLLDAEIKKNTSLELQWAKVNEKRDELSSQLQQKEADIARLEKNVKVLQVIHYKTRFQRFLSALSTGTKITVVSALTGALAGFVFLYTDAYATIPLVSPYLLANLGILGTLATLANAVFVLTALLLTAGAIISANREKKAILQQEKLVEKLTGISPAMSSTANIDKMLEQDVKMQRAQVIQVVVEAPPKAAKPAPSMFSLAGLKSIFWNMDAKKAADKNNEVIVKNSSYPAAKVR